MADDEPGITWADILALTEPPSTYEPPPPIVVPRYAVPYLVDEDGNLPPGLIVDEPLPRGHPVPLPRPAVGPPQTGDTRMRKIPTLFRRDPDDMRRVTREVHPDCQWVLDGEGVPTRKYDGTCVMVENGRWWARRDVKPGKSAPAGFRPVETDETTGKTVGWEPAEQSSFWPYLDEADHNRSMFDPWYDGTYELCGPKVNRNPEGYERHFLVKHEEADEFEDAPRDHDGLRAWLLAHAEFEGIVWHHPDGRMAKLKRRDFEGAQYA